MRYVREYQDKWGVGARELLSLEFRTNWAKTATDASPFWDANSAVASHDTKSEEKPDGWEVDKWGDKTTSTSGTTSCPVTETKKAAAWSQPRGLPTAPSIIIHNAKSLAEAHLLQDDIRRAQLAEAKIRVERAEAMDEDDDAYHQQPRHEIHVPSTSTWRSPPHNPHGPPVPPYTYYPTPSTASYYAVTSAPYPPRAPVAQLPPPPPLPAVAPPAESRESLTLPPLRSNAFLPNLPLTSGGGGGSFVTQPQYRSYSDDIRRGQMGPNNRMPIEQFMALHNMPRQVPQSPQENGNHDQRLH